MATTARGQPAASPPPAEVVIGLDAGTTSVKAAAFGVGSPWRCVAIRDYPLLERTPGQAVQDPFAILAASSEALTECVQAARGATVVAVSVSAAMHGLMALNGELSPLTELVTWADARARKQARELRASPGVAAALHAATGVPVHPMTPLTKLMWFARHEPQVFAPARWWVGLKEWLLLWLTGRVVTELSSASGTGLLDLVSRDWNAEAVKLSGISADRLPPILPTTALLGLSAAAARTVGLAPGTPVVTGAGDGPLANLGTGAIAPGLAGLSLGTSGAIRMAIRQPRVDTSQVLFCYALTETAWVLGAPISNGGSVLSWAGRALAPDLPGTGRGDPAAVLELAATAPPGCGGLVMLPYLLPERAPLWDPGLTAAYLGLRHEHTRAHLARAAVEGVCLQLRLILDRLEEVMPVSAVRATGGAFRSPLWRQVLAAMLGRPIAVTGEAEGSALGAAALGIFALGRAPALSDALKQLADSAAAPQDEQPSPQLVREYERLRASVPALIEGLSQVAGLLR